MLACTAAFAQEQEETSSAADRIHIGGSIGPRFTWTRFTKLGETMPPATFPEKADMRYTLAGGAFFEFEIGEKRWFSIRLEVDWLQRRMFMQGINYSTDAAHYSNIDNVDYYVHAKYVDFRLPLIWHFGKVTNVRPYIMVAPVYGLVRGGKVGLDFNDAQNVPPALMDKIIDGTKYELDLNKNSINANYFAVMAGLGVQIPIKVGHSHFDIGLEAAYEYGITDTYSDKETRKNPTVESVAMYQIGNGDGITPGGGQINGKRMLQGLEVKAVVAVPFSIFSKPKKPEPIVIRDTIVQTNTVTQIVRDTVETVRVDTIETVRIDTVAPEYERKACYTLEEILESVNKGEPIEGKTICAIGLINFEFNKSNIMENSYAYLDQIVDLILKTGVSVEVKGNQQISGIKIQSHCICGSCKRSSKEHNGHRHRK